MKKFVLLFLILSFANFYSQDSINYFDLGKKEMGNMNLDGAIDFLTKAIELEQNESEAYFARGLCFNMKKDFSSSVKDFENAEKLGFDNIMLYTLRGYAYNQIGNDDLAIKDLDTALNLDPKFNPKNYFNRAALRIKVGKYDLALNGYNEYLKIVNDGNGFFERGKLLKFLGKKDEACKDFENSINLGNDNLEVISLKEDTCK